MNKVTINEWLSYADIINQCEKHFRASNYIQNILYPFLEKIKFSENDKLNICNYAANAINVNADHYIINVKKIIEENEIYATYDINPEKFINEYFLRQILRMPNFKEFIIYTQERALEFPDRISLFYKNETSVLCVYTHENKIYKLQEISFNFKDGQTFIKTINKYLTMSKIQLNELIKKYIIDENED